MKKTIAFFIILATVGFPICYAQIQNNVDADKDIVPTEIQLSIVMYHTILNSRRGTFIISEQQLEEDLQSYAEAGYETVFPSEIINFVKGRGVLPNKPLLITFDDGFYNNLYYAAPLFKKYNAKGLVNIIGVHSEYASVSGDNSKANYSHLTWKQINELIDTGLFEIGNHTYDLHNQCPRYGVGQKSGESKTAYRRAIEKDVMKLQDLLQRECGITPLVFAYPFGKFSPTAQETLIDNGFEMLLTCTEKNNRLIQGDISCLYALNRFNRDSKYSSKQFVEKIAKSA